MCLDLRTSLVVNDQRGFRVSMLKELHRNRVTLAWAIGMVFFLWMAVSVFTGGTHQVCVGGGGVSQLAPGGECYEWETVQGAPTLPQAVGFAWIPVGLAFACGYAAVKTHRRESRT